VKIESEYIGFYELNDISNIRCTREKGHIQIKFIDTDRIEYSVNLYRKKEKGNKYNGNFISHSIDTKEENSSGEADCKLIKNEDEYYLIGYWTEDSIRYGWTFLITPQKDLV
jgi:hypothetical protein